jgi:carotenoid cleavage dioxygenase
VNEFLEGPYAPVKEERTETELRVTGDLPVELNGLYARIGPNPIDVPNPGLYHWFLGDGMVHGLRLNEGRAVWYRNRWVRTARVNKALGRPDVPGQRRAVIDTVNTNIVWQGGRLWALVEAGPLPIELNGELESVRQGYFDSALARAYSAHPHRDPATGDLHAVLLRRSLHDPRQLRARRFEVPRKPGRRDSGQTRTDDSRLRDHGVECDRCSTCPSPSRRAN